MNTGKVRRRLVEEQVRIFRDACEYVVDRPLLLWAPHVDRAAKLLIAAVAKHKKRQRVWSGQKKRD